MEMGIIKGFAPKECLKCKKEMRKVWLYKGLFLCYTCYTKEYSKNLRNKKEVKNNGY